MVKGCWKLFWMLRVSLSNSAGFCVWMVFNDLTCSLPTDETDWVSGTLRTEKWLRCWVSNCMFCMSSIVWYTAQKAIFLTKRPTYRGTQTKKKKRGSDKLHRFNTQNFFCLYFVVVLDMNVFLLAKLLLFHHLNSF